MDFILDKLFIKRFCLPSNIDTSLYEKETINSCLCGKFNHASCIIYKKNILSFGYNEGDIHAEHDAINNLLDNKKTIKSISILVIRFTKHNKIQCSKPCYNCIDIIKNLPNKKGYKIKHIYYSNDKGEIIKTNIKNLDNNHISRGYRNY